MTGISIVRPSSTEPPCLYTPSFVQHKSKSVFFLTSLNPLVDEPVRSQTQGKGSSRVEPNIIRMIPRARSPLSIDASIRVMDHFNDANFHAWIKNQGNAAVIARHLGRLMADYTEEQLAAGLRWLFEDWQLINISIVMRVMLIDGCPERRRREAILRMITAGWARNHVEHLFYLLKQPVDKLY